MRHEFRQVPRMNFVIIYTLCSIPLCDGKQSSTDHFSVCIHSKKTGEKIFQTQVMNGAPSKITMEGENIFVATNQDIFMYSKEGQLIRKFQLSKATDYDIISTKTHVCSASQIGILDIFVRNTSSKRKCMVAKNNVSPVLVEESLLWVTEKGIYEIWIQGTAIRQLSAQEFDPLSSPIYMNKKLYFIESSGALTSFDYETHEIIQQPLLKDMTIKEIHNSITGNPWFVFTDEHLFRMIF